jgi:hypothetical protein
MRRWHLIAASVALGALAVGVWTSPAGAVISSQRAVMLGAGSAGGASCTYTPVTTGTINVAYTGATPSASGGVPAYTFSETGSLPTGLTINSSTGIISGTPTVSGSFPGIQVKVTDTVPQIVNCGSSFTLTIGAAACSGTGLIFTIACNSQYVGIL